MYMWANDQERFVHEEVDERIELSMYGSPRLAPAFPRCPVFSGRDPGEMSDGDLGAVLAVGTVGHLRAGGSHFCQ